MQSMHAFAGTGILDQRLSRTDGTVIPVLLTMARYTCATDRTCYPRLVFSSDPFHQVTPLDDLGRQDKHAGHRDEH